MGHDRDMTLKVSETPVLTQLTANSGSGGFGHPGEVPSDINEGSG